MLSTFGLKGPPPPLIVMLAKAIGLQLESGERLSLSLGSNGAPSCACAVDANRTAMAQEISACGRRMMIIYMVSVGVSDIAGALPTLVALRPRANLLKVNRLLLSAALTN